MPPKKSREQLLRELRTNKQGRTFQELKAILGAYGFVMHPRNKGSHRVFGKLGCFQSPSIPEAHGPVKVAYVRKVIQALEECTGEEGEGG